MGYNMKGFSGFGNSPAKQVDEHNIAAEKLNTTRETCIVCGASISDHKGKDHAFKVQSPPGPDTKTTDMSKLRAKQRRASKGISEFQHFTKPGSQGDEPIVEGTWGGKKK